MARGRADARGDPAQVRLVGYAVADEVVPGEERTVTVACDPRAFRLWNEAASDWEAPSGGTFLIAEVSATSASRFPVPERGCRGSLADACLSRFQR
jgi:hypothetical protein